MGAFPKGRRLRAKLDLMDGRKNTKERGIREAFGGESRVEGACRKKVVYKEGMGG